MLQDSYKQTLFEISFVSPVKIIQIRKQYLLTIINRAMQNMLGNYYLFTKTLCTCCGFVCSCSIWECICSICCPKSKQCCPTCCGTKIRSQHLFLVKERSAKKNGVQTSEQSLQSIFSVGKHVGDLNFTEETPVCCNFQFCCCTTLYYQLTGYSTELTKTLTPCLRIPFCLSYPVENGGRRVGQIVPKLSFLPYCCSYLSLQNQENIEAYTIQRDGYNFCRKTWSIKKKEEIVAYLRDIGCCTPEIEVDLPESSSQNQKLVIMSTIPFLP